MAIQLNPLTKVVEITTPTTTVTVQELVNTIRDWEDELGNLSYNKVIDAVGKADLGGSVYTAITLTMSDTWQIQFWNGVVVGYIKDGTVVGGVGGYPVKPTGGADTIIVNNQVGGTISLSGGSAPTVEQIRIEMDANSTRLASIDDGVVALRDESGGKWELVGNQMIFYKADNLTEIFRFNLFDASGNPAMANVYKRERVP